MAQERGKYSHDQNRVTSAPLHKQSSKFFWSHLLIWPWLKETCCQAQYKAAENYTSVKLRRAGTALMVKDLPASAGDGRDVGLIPGSERSPGEGSGNPLQYSCPENPMDRGAQWITLHGITKSLTQLSNFNSLHFMYNVLQCLLSPRHIRTHKTLLKNK